MAILTRSFQNWNTHPPPLLEGVAVDGSQLSSSPGIALAKRSCLLLLGRNCLEGQVNGLVRKPYLNSDISEGLSQLQSSRGGSREALFATTTFPSASSSFRCSITLFLWASLHQISCMQISVSISREPHLQCPSLSQSLGCSRQIRAHHWSQRWCQSHYIPSAPLWERVRMDLER